jgi:hypothetical protein
MSIKRLLPLAILVAIGACSAGPNAICTVDTNSESYVCAPALSTPVVEIALPGEDRSTVP